jgi:hypothetical protein
MVLDEEDEKDREEDNQTFGSSFGDTFVTHSDLQSIGEDDIDARFAQMGLPEQDDFPIGPGQHPTSITSTPFTESPLLATPKAPTEHLYSHPKLPQNTPPLYPQNPVFVHPMRFQGSPAGTQFSGLKFHPNGTVSSSSTNSPQQSQYRTPGGSSSGSSGPSILGSPMTSPLSSQSTAQTSGYLALFNQFAAQKHLTPSWVTDSAGPPHRPTFTAKVTSEYIWITYTPWLEIQIKFADVLQYKINKGSERHIISKVPSI